jgi:hypothetical protein
VYMRLQRISKVHRTIGRNELPAVRICLSISSIPTRRASLSTGTSCRSTFEPVPFHTNPSQRMHFMKAGGGLVRVFHVMNLKIIQSESGTKYEGIYFRRCLLDTIREIGEFRRLLLPS